MFGMPIPLRVCWSESAHATQTCLIKLQNLKTMKNSLQKIKKVLAFPKNLVYNSNCCDMIAKKREVAIRWMGFPWSECQETVDQHITVGKPDGKSLYVT